jgi:tetratricopeptide (TPR) repeat protein
MSKKAYLIPLFVLVAGLAVRVLFTLQVRDMPFYYHPVLDSGFFHQWAAFKVNGHWIDRTLPFREPGYAFFLAAVYRIFGDSMTAARMVQAALGGMTALLAYWLGSALFNRLAGAVAGFIMAFYSLAVFFSGELNETALAVFLLVLSCYLIVRTRAGKPYMLAFLSGLTLGFAFLSRFTLIAALPAWALQLLLDKSPRLRGAVVLLVLGFAAVPALYNVFLLDAGTFSFFPMRAGWEAFLGSPATGGTAKKTHYVIDLGGEAGASRAYAETGLTDGERDAVRFAKIETGGPMTIESAGRYWGGRALGEFFSAPSRYLAGWADKIGIVWGPSLPSPNIDSRYIAGRSLLLRIFFIPFAVLAGVGLVGLIVFTRRRSSSLPAFVGLYTVLAALYLVSDADKMMLVPFLAVFSGQVGAEVYYRLRKGAVRAGVFYIIAAAAASVLLWQLPREPVDEARHLMIMGDVYAKESMFDKAEETYDKAIDENPDYSDARISLARLFATTGKPDRALATLTAASEIDPDNPQIHIEKAALLNYVGRPMEALDELAAVEDSYPYEPRLHQTKGLVLLGLGHPEAAVQEIDKQLEYVGGDFLTYSTLGRAELELEQYEEAAAALEAALAYNPYSSSTVMELADCYNKLDKPKEAIEVLLRVIKVDPGNVRLRFKLGNALYRAGRYSDALRNFKEISKFDPRNTDILLNMGVVYAAVDSLDQAVATWEKVLQIDPQNQTALDNLRKAGQ